MKSVRGMKETLGITDEAILNLTQIAKKDPDFIEIFGRSLVPNKDQITAKLFEYKEYLDVHIRDYNQDMFIKIIEHFTEHFTSNHRKKYLKYKNKYIELKKN